MTAADDDVFDCVGIGIGPSNLSLACLLHPLADLRCRFLDQRGGFVWHEGMLLPRATIQVAFIKDLVSLADPTNPFSFLAFLRDNKRIYQFLNARFDAARRVEFNQYFQWACSKLNALQFSSRVVGVDFDGDFVVRTEHERFRARNIAIGSGRIPSVPTWARSNLGPTVFHSADFLTMPTSLSGKRVMVVGGGQSGAEVFLELISRSREALPSSCVWLTRRGNFFPIDDSPFTNEFFTPSYACHFYGLAPGVRGRLLHEQKLASDGISPETLRSIYQALYDHRHLQRSALQPTLRPSFELTEMHRCGTSWQLSGVQTTTGARSALDADVVVLATGYRFQVPSWLEPVAPRLQLCGQEATLNRDFSAVWDGPANRRIYMQNAARSQWGIADPNLSLLSWRSGQIVNSLLGWRAYDLDECPAMVDWMEDGAAQLERQELYETR